MAPSIAADRPHAAPGAEMSAPEPATFPLDCLQNVAHLDDLLRLSTFVDVLKAAGVKRFAITVESLP